MSDTLIYQESQYPSRGNWILAFLAVLAPVTIEWMLSGDLRWRVEVWTGVSVFLVLRLLLLKLTVTVSFAELRLTYPLGWPRKRINRSDIRSVTPVRDWTRDARAVRSASFKWIQGRRQGVLLVLVGDKSVMVGADDPDVLVAALNA